MNMNNETEKNYQLFKDKDKINPIFKVFALENYKRTPETPEQKEKREFFNWLFDKFLIETEIGRIPPEYNRSSVYCDFDKFVHSKPDKSKFIKIELTNSIEYIPDTDSFIENLTTDSWNEFLNTTYEPVKVETGTKLNYITSSEDKAKKRMYDKIVASIKPKATEPKPFNGFLRELSDKQLDKLFEILTTGYKYTIEHSGKPKELIEKIKYIDSDINSFKYVFGGKDKPVNFKPIVFLENKQILRQVLTELQKEVKFNKQHPETKELSNEIVRQTPFFFIDDKNEPFELAKNDNRKSNPELIKYILATI